MRRIVLSAFSQCIALTAFCQSPAITTAAAQNESGLPSTLVEPLFSLESGLNTRSVPFQAQPCSADRKEAAKPDASWHFKPPCLDPRVFAMSARNNMQALLPSGMARPIPIPTEWPNARFEPIPTEWPNLKMLPIAQLAAKPAK
ncbi:hypothetical protein [Occallatibacter savannae]|uniref:hypothetical protein n=1 Tax=Occallatibacter savannae TaxID=1002691 RepID=UPI000D685A7E|nr:hypothetical protein [Occallatibacter savannae]